MITVLRNAASVRPECSSPRALLERNPDPTETEIRYWLAGNLCRCTGYVNIVESVRHAAGLVAAQGASK